MIEYEVGLVFDAGIGVTIIAESPEEAASMAYDRDECSPTLCHYCANGVELGECVGVTVFEDGEEVYTDIPHYTLMNSMSEKIKRLERELHECQSMRSQLQEELKEAGLE